MALHCWSLIEFIFNRSVVVFNNKPADEKKNNKGDIQCFPDDILIDILSRLPAESVLQCRRVCKRWQNITSMPHFTELQFKNCATPLILSQFLYRSQHVYSTNEADGRLTISPLCRYLAHLMNKKIIRDVICCHRGLILYRVITFSPKFIFSICNPITRENVTLPILRKEERVCGLFFHPVAMEHRVLYAHDAVYHFGYKIFSLERNSLRELPCISYDAPCCYNPVIANGGNLHWIKAKNNNIHKRSRRSGSRCANFILRFDVRSEVVDTIPHPGYRYCSEIKHKAELVEIEGELCYCSIQKTGSLSVWILADSEKKHWVKRYKTSNIFHSMDYYPLPGGVYHPQNNIGRGVTIIGIHNDELIFEWICAGLFRYRLKHATLHKIEVEKKCWSDALRDVWYSTAFVYKKSLVSLRHSLPFLSWKKVEGCHTADFFSLN